MERRVLKFRRLKHGPPKKLPVLRNDARPSMSAAKFTLLVMGLAATSFGASVMIESGAVTFADAAKILPRDLWDSACQIKGNISVVSEERIFHVPGQEYYTPTRIDYLKGERWFCSEADAIAAGWRKAGQ